MLGIGKIEMLFSLYIKFTKVQKKDDLLYSPRTTASR